MTWNLCNQITSPTLETKWERTKIRNRFNTKKTYFERPRDLGEIMLPVFMFVLFLSTDHPMGQHLNLNLNLNSLLVKRQIDNPSPGAVTGGN